MIAIGAILAHGVGREPALERGQIDERLERGAGLALGGDGAIELAFGVIAAADQRAHRAVRRHRDDRALLDAELFALARQFLDQRLLGQRLQSRIDRGLDHDIVLDAADQIVEHVHDPVGDIIDRAGAGRLQRMRGTARSQPWRVLVGDEAGIRHRGEDDLRAPLRAVRIAASARAATAT